MNGNDIFYDKKPYGDDYEAVVKLCDLKKGDIFIDIGANTGQEIDFFQKKGLVIKKFVIENNFKFYNW